MEKLLYVHNTSVRINDVNYGQHLDHAKLLSMLHDARANFLYKHGLNETNCFGKGMIVLELQVNYIEECNFLDQLKINLYIEDIKGAKILFKYAVINQLSDKTVATATVKMCFFDKEKRCAVKPSREFTALINSISC